MMKNDDNDSLILQICKAPGNIQQILKWAVEWPALVGPQHRIQGHGWGVIDQETLVLAFLVTGASPPP